MLSTLGDEEERINMTSDSLLDAIDARKTFVAFANAFRQNDLDVVGQGWVGTRSKIEQLLKHPDTFVATQDKLSHIYLKNVLYTHKAVMLWSIDRDVAQQLAASLDEFVDQTSPYLAAYPYPLSTEVLTSTTVLGVPTAVHHFSNGHTLVFSSKRAKTEEEVMPPENIPDNLRAAGFTEMVVKKKLVYQVFDSITVTPDKGLVEMRIDLAKNLSEKDIFKYREAIRTRFNSQVKEILDIDILLGDALNLVDALEPLYRGTDWVVSRIDHVNEGGYNNSNRGRHRSDDVRADDYHKNGEAAVNHLQLWNVNAVFSSQQGFGSPTLILEGHSSMLSSLHPYMDLARILDCVSEEDYQLVLSTLLSCLTPTAATTAPIAQPEQETEPAM